MTERLRKLTIDFDKRRVHLESDEARILRINIDTLEWDFITPPPGAEPVKISIEQKPENLPQKPENEAKKTITLTGRVKGKGNSGRPDNNGRPTYWWMFAAHQEGSEEPWMLSTVFYRNAALVAATLHPEDQVTLEGYLNPSTDPKRKDIFRAFYIPDHPGKRTKNDS